MGHNPKLERLRREHARLMELEDEAFLEKENARLRKKHGVKTEQGDAFDQGVAQTGIPVTQVGRGKGTPA